MAEKDQAPEVSEGGTYWEWEDEFEEFEGAQEGLLLKEERQ